LASLASFTVPLVPLVDRIADVEDDDVDEEDEDVDDDGDVDDELKFELFSLAFDENTFELQLDRLLELLTLPFVSNLIVWYLALN
jgi:hypothetical protein